MSCLWPSFCYMIHRLGLLLMILLVSSEVFCFLFFQNCFSYAAIKRDYKESVDMGRQSWEWVNGGQFWRIRQRGSWWERGKQNWILALCAVSWCLRKRHQRHIYHLMFISNIFKVLLHYRINCLPQLRSLTIICFWWLMNGCPFLGTWRVTKKDP